jgi:hypothetical protein
MLVIRGDTRVADIYFGEFMRSITTTLATSFASSPTRPSDPEAGYLKENPVDWLPPHSTAELQVEAAEILHGAEKNGWLGRVRSMPVTREVAAPGPRAILEALVRRGRKSMRTFAERKAPWLTNTPLLAGALRPI